MKVKFLLIFLLILPTKVNSARLPPVVIAQKGVEITAIKSKINKFSNDSKIIMNQEGLPFVFSKKDGFKNLITGKEILKDPKVEDLGFLPNGGLLTISNSRLGHFSGSEIIEKINLPHSGMKLTAMDDLRVLIYGGEAEWQRDAYVINSDGTFKKFISAPERIVDISVQDSRVLFATLKSVYEIRSSGSPKNLITLFNDSIQSLSLIPGKEGFLLSTDLGVFLVNKGKMTPLITNVNCQVKFSKNTPFAFCPDRDLFVKIELNYSELPSEFTSATEVKTKKGKKKWKK
jgi:hypothetical protein